MSCVVRNNESKCEDTYDIVRETLDQSQINIINKNCNKMEGTQRTYHDKFEASVLIDLDQICFPHLETFRPTKKRKS